MGASKWRAPINQYSAIVAIGIVLSRVQIKSMSFSTISRICGSESTPLPSASQDIMSFGWLRFHPSVLETGVAAPLYFYYRSAKVHARPSARAAMYYYTFGQFA